MHFMKKSTERSKRFESKNDIILRYLRSGKAFQMDQRQCPCTILVSNGYTSSDRFTLSLFIAIPFPQAGDATIATTKRVLTDNGGYSFLYNPSGIFKFYDSAGNMVTWQQTLVTGGAFSHVALIVDGTGVQLYVNSVVVETSKGIARTTTSQQGTRFGAAINNGCTVGVAYLMSGIFDEIYLFPTVLTSAQISILSQAQKLKRSQMSTGMSTPQGASTTGVYVSMYRQSARTCPLSIPYRCGNGTCVSDVTMCCTVTCADGSCQPLGGLCTAPLTLCPGQTMVSSFMIIYRSKITKL